MQKKKNPIFISLICNIALMVAKGITGLLANSNALVADAIHSLIDVSVFFISYRLAKDCEMYHGINRKKASEEISQKLINSEVYATYYTGILFFTIGTAIYFHNLIILILDRVEKPDFITFIVSLISLSFYAWLYRYVENIDNHRTKDCVFASRNTHWQNMINLFSAGVVAIGLTGAILGFAFLDELAALVVGSMILGMGLSWIMKARKNFNEAEKRYFKLVIIGSILMAVVLTIISLSIQL